MPSITHIHKELYVLVDDRISIAYQYFSTTREITDVTTNLEKLFGYAAHYYMDLDIGEAEGE